MQFFFGFCLFKRSFPKGFPRSEHMFSSHRKVFQIVFANSFKSYKLSKLWSRLSTRLIHIIAKRIARGGPDHSLCVSRGSQRSQPNWHFQTIYFSKDLFSNQQNIRLKQTKNTKTKKQNYTIQNDLRQSRHLRVLFRDKRHLTCTLNNRN